MFDIPPQLTNSPSRADSRHYLDFVSGSDILMQPGQLNKNSTFVFENTTTHLPPPTLDITYNLSDHYYTLTRVPSARTAAYLPESYLLAHASCSPGAAYQWGFSYIFLFMISIFNFVWACVVVGMWLDVRARSRVYAAGRRPGLLRSVLDLAGVLGEEVGDDGRIGEGEIRRRVRRGGGKLVVPRGETRIVRVGSGRGDGDEDKGGWRRRLTKGSTF